MRVPSLKHLAFALLSLLIVTGALRSVAVLNVENDKFITASQPLEQRAMEIKHAGIRRGWKMDDAGRGHIKGTIDQHALHAEIMVDFTETSFSIHYVNSQNLNFENGMIHPTYNRWIEYLERDIKTSS